MSWFRKSENSWLQSLCIKVLKNGPLPRHVAFIMDGNRRYANKLSIHKIQGHVLGFEKLTETLQWCQDLGITEVTVYAFSIENFKRSEEEVNGLMELAREKFKKLLEEKEKIDEYGVCIKILGDLKLLPADLQQMVAEVMLYSQSNNRAYFNVCLAYTSREEISAAVRDIAQGVESNLLLPSDISEELLDQCLYTAKSPPPDLLLRTSGEVRLSDFLLWQSSYSFLSFMKILWPEFNIWHFFGAVAWYQHHYKFLQDIKNKHHKQLKEIENEDLLRGLDVTSKEYHLSDQKSRVENFINDLQNKRHEQLKNMSITVN